MFNLETIVQFSPSFFYGVCFVTPVHSPVEKFNDIFSAGVTKSATIRLNSERLHHVSTPTFYSTWLIHSISLLASMNVTECELHKLWKLKIEFRLVSCFRPMRLSIFSTSLTDRFPYVPVMYRFLSTHRIYIYIYIYIYMPYV